MNVRILIPYAVVALGSALYLWPQIQVMVGGDEGTLIMGAIRVLEGQVPFRDFFEVVGPGSFYWLALFFRVLGTTWLTTRIYLIITAVSASLLLFALSRRLRMGFWPLLFVLAISFPLWSGVSHHVDSNLFALISFSLFLRWLDNHRPATMVATGVFSAIASCFLQTKGGLLFGSYLIVLWLLYRKERVFRSSAAQLTAGFLVVGALVVVLFWHANGLPGLIYANFSFPLTQYGDVNYTPYGYGLGLTTASLQAAFGTPVSAILVTPYLFVVAIPLLLGAYGFIYPSSAFNRETLPYWIAGIGMWMSELHRKDLIHIIYGSPILVILVFHLYGKLQIPFAGVARGLIVASAGLLASFNPLWALAAQKKLTTPRGIVYTFNGGSAAEGVEYLNSHLKEGDELFAYPYCPMCYFLTGKENPTRYSIMLYSMNTDDQFRDAVRSIEAKRVRYVVWDATFPDPAKILLPSYRVPDRDRLIVEPYLIAKYHIVKIENGVRILERNGDGK